MLKTGGKISVAVIIILLLSMTILHQRREYTSNYSPYTNEGYINVNFFQHKVETDSDVSPIDYYYYSYGELSLLTLSIISIVVAIYLLVNQTKEGVFFISDKVKLTGYILLVLVSLASAVLFFPLHPNTGVVQIDLTHKLIVIILSLIPIGALIALNFKHIQKLGVSFLFLLMFISTVIGLSMLDMYWFIFMIEVMGSIVVVSLLLDDVAKVNATVYTVYKED